MEGQGDWRGNILEVGAQKGKYIGGRGDRRGNILEVQGDRKGNILEVQGDRRGIYWR